VKKWSLNVVLLIVALTIGNYCVDENWSIVKDHVVHGVIGAATLLVLLSLENFFSAVAKLFQRKAATML
jgi:hypothetical protein